MKAAVLHTLGQAPRCDNFVDPIPENHEVLVHVEAASLKNIDKMMADGSHYDSHHNLPIICGVDGVGTLDDGTRVYFGGPRAPYGTMAEKTVANRGWCLPVPDGLDAVTAAALPNPAMSAWLSLNWRAKLQPGETVLILGATGAAGKLAIQIAKHLEAGRIVAAGRNEAVLSTLLGLGADAIIPLTQSQDELTKAFAREAGKGYDVVIDYIWGHPTEALIAAITGDDTQAEPVRTRLIQVGEMAGANISLPAGALRSSGLEIYGSGGGSVPHSAIFEAFQQVMALAAEGKLHVDVEPIPLAEVESAWQRQDLGGRRLVIVP
jgi:NADPH:quinone reductase-like Zn-dependent oxidoreductase